MGIGSTGMTDEEHNAEIAKAVREYSENKARIACLERRLGEFSRLIQSFVNNPDLSDSRLGNHLDGMRGFQADPRQDAGDLKQLHDKQAQLRKFFDAHNLSIN